MDLFNKVHIFELRKVHNPVYYLSVSLEFGGIPIWQANRQTCKPIYI